MRLLLRDFGPCAQIRFEVSDGAPASGLMNGPDKKCFYDR